MRGQSRVASMALEVAAMISALEGAGPSSSSLSTTVKGEEMCWRESWGRCILFQRRKAWPARREKAPRPASRSSLAVVDECGS